MRMLDTKDPNDSKTKTQDPSILHSLLLRSPRQSLNLTPLREEDPRRRRLRFIRNGVVITYHTPLIVSKMFLVPGYRRSLQPLYAL